MTSETKRKQVIELLEKVELKPAADEPTAMLDVSLRMGILKLLRSLKHEMGLTMLFITHDLTSAGYMCDRIAVMYRGKIVEIGTSHDLIRKR